MSNTVWGIVWVKDERDENDEPVWYESEEDAIIEYNERGWKYWASRLVTGTITSVEVKHNGYNSVPPWERGYDGNYYLQEKY